MTFWGVEIKPGKPFTLPRGKIQITQATLGAGRLTNRSVVQCKVGDKSPVLICALLPEKTEGCPLNLQFDEEDQVIFSVLGPRSVHLTGFYCDDDSYPRCHDQSADNNVTEDDIDEVIAVDDDDDVVETSPPSDGPKSIVISDSDVDGEDIGVKNNHALCKVSDSEAENILPISQKSATNDSKENDVTEKKKKKRSRDEDHGCAKTKHMDHHPTAMPKKKNRKNRGADGNQPQEKQPNDKLIEPSNDSCTPLQIDVNTKNKNLEDPVAEEQLNDKITNFAGHVTDQDNGEVKKKKKKKKVQNVAEGGEDKN